MTRRLLRWTVVILTLGLIGQLARWYLAERRSSRRLAVTTAPWPDVEASPSSPRSLPQRGTRTAGHDGARTGSDPAARPLDAIPTPPAEPAPPAAGSAAAGPRAATPRAGTQADGARADGARADGAEAVGDSQAWVAALDGACPPGYPVKTKLRSRLYHLPGMLAYERTGPDRCYSTAEAAEADGFTRAKR